MPVTVTREIEDTDVAAWLRSVPETELAFYRQAAQESSRAKLLDSMHRLQKSFRASGATEDDLKEALEMDDEEFNNLFRG